MGDPVAVLPDSFQVVELNKSYPILVKRLFEKVSKVSSFQIVSTPDSIKEGCESYL